MITTVQVRRKLILEGSIKAAHQMSSRAYMSNTKFSICTAHTDILRHESYVAVPSIDGIQLFWAAQMVGLRPDCFFVAGTSI